MQMRGEIFRNSEHKQGDWHDKRIQPLEVQRNFRCEWPGAHMLKRKTCHKAQVRLAVQMRDRVSKPQKSVSTSKATYTIP